MKKYIDIFRLLLKPICSKCRQNNCNSINYIRRIKRPKGKLEDTLNILKEIVEIIYINNYPNLMKTGKLKSSYGKLKKYRNLWLREANQPF